QLFEPSGIFASKRAGHAHRVLDRLSKRVPKGLRHPRRPRRVVQHPLEIFRLGQVTLDAGSAGGREHVDQTAQALRVGIAKIEWTGTRSEKNPSQSLLGLLVLRRVAQRPHLQRAQALLERRIRVGVTTEAQHPGGTLRSLNDRWLVRSTQKKL